MRSPARIAEKIIGTGNKEYGMLRVNGNAGLVTRIMRRRNNESKP
jgi:hypothetical protein